MLPKAAQLLAAVSNAAGVYLRTAHRSAARHTLQARHISAAAFSTSSMVSSSGERDSLSNQDEAVLSFLKRQGFRTSTSQLSTLFEEQRLEDLKNCETLVLETRKMGAACLTMNRPSKKNALSKALVSELHDHMFRLDEDPDIKAIIITGSNNSFSVGADIAELATVKGYNQAHKERLLEFWNRIMGVRKPLIAAIHGPALGGGLELAMACDIVYATASSTFALPEIKLGLIPGGGGTQRLTRRVGKARAMEMILLGEKMDAFEAKRYGLCTRVVPDDEVVMLAFDKAQELVSLSEPVLCKAKEVVNASFEMPLEEGLLLEKREFWSNFALEDPHEGMAAFLEKRSPKFEHQ